MIMHFNARFDEKVDTLMRNISLISKTTKNDWSYQIVVRNTQVGGAWQSEEREGKFPFEKEQGFDLIIANEPYAFQVHPISQLSFLSYIISL